MILVSSFDIPVMVSTGAYFQARSVDYVYESIVPLTYLFTLTPLQTFKTFPTTDNTCLENNTSPVCQAVRAIRTMLDNTEEVQHSAI